MSVCARAGRCVFLVGVLTHSQASGSVVVSRRKVKLAGSLMMTEYLRRGHRFVSTDLYAYQLMVTTQFGDVHRRMQVRERLLVSETPLV